MCVAGPQRISIGCPKPGEEPIAAGMFQSDGKFIMVSQLVWFPRCRFLFAKTFSGTFENCIVTGSYQVKGLSGVFFMVFVIVSYEKGV